MYVMINWMFYIIGSKNPWGLTAYTGNNTCPVGSYCPLGSQLPLACPPGTFNSKMGMNSLSDCTACTPGHYCAGFNLSHVSGVCDPGYYCSGGSTVPNPIHESGGICPEAAYCPAGTAFPHPVNN